VRVRNGDLIFINSSETYHKSLSFLGNREFTGKVLKAITEAAKVKRSTTMPIPQAKGQVERTNKTIAQMLSKKDAMQIQEKSRPKAQGHPP
jgi:hypothetical protein